MSRKIHRPILDKRGLVVPVEQGGTNANTLPQAAVELDLLTFDMLDIVNGGVTLDAQGHINPAIIPNTLIFDSLHVDGPALLHTNDTAVFVITDYDQFKTYTLSATAGIISRHQDKVYYTAPDTAGNYTITINGVDIPIEVQALFVSKPDIIYPLADNTNMGSEFIAVADDLEILGLKSYKSLRFKASVSSALSKAYGINPVDTSFFKKTFSVWVKRGSLGTYQCIISHAIDNTNYWYIGFDTNNKLWLYCYNQGTSGGVNLNKVTTIAYTGSNWMHITVSVDTTLSIDEDRVKLYIDGVRITSFSTNTIPNQNAYSLSFFSTLAAPIWQARIGNFYLNSVNKFDGYMTEFNVIDGQAFDPTSFGEMDANLGIWVPKQYTGSYGTNGFYLDFKDNSTLFDLGRDKSGRGNNWTCNNISLTAGVTYDSMDDNPVKNYSIMDRSKSYGTASINLQQGGLLVQIVNNSQAAIANTQFITYGKYYVEFIAGDNQNIFGVVPDTWNYTNNPNTIAGTVSYYSLNGNSFISAVQAAYGAAYTTNDVIGMALDMDAKTITFYKNGVSQGLIKLPLVNNAYGFVIMSATGVATVTTYANFGQRPFSYQPPKGFKALYTPELHSNTDWELSDTADFSNIINQATADTANKQSWSVSNLIEDKDYFLRTRYNSTEYGSSEWSDIQHIKTRASFLPTNEIGTLTAYDKVANDNYGLAVALSGDGQYLAISAYLKDVTVADAGKVYIYAWSGSAWVLDAELTAYDKVASDRFGLSLALTSDGSRLAVGSFKTVLGLTAAGKVYTYTRSGSTWTLEAEITAGDKAANDYFGMAVAFAADGSRLAVGASNKTVGGIAAAGQVYIYTRSGATYTQESTLSASDKVASDSFGLGLSLDSTASRLAVGATGRDPSAVSGAGQVYIYTRSGSVWTLEATITAADKVANDAFGRAVAFNTDGSILVTSSYLRDILGINDVGKVYIYTRSGSVYTLETELTASDKVASDGFGVSVALSADVSRLAVGAYAKAISGVAGAGQVYLFS